MLKIMSDATGLAEDEIDINALIASSGANVLTESSLKGLANSGRNNINAI